MKRNFIMSLMAMALLMLAVLSLHQVFASPSTVTYTVNNTSDVPASAPLNNGVCETALGNGICTLRAAVMKANHTGGVGATIMVPSGIYSLTISVIGSDGEEEGDLNLTTPTTSGSPVITIIGAGASTTIIDANQLDRVFRVLANRTATISGITIRDGYFTGANAFGGGIYNQGSLTVSDAVIMLNHSTALGGGIWNSGSLILMNSTISQNTADSSGGGIRNDVGSVVVINSTLSQNNSGLNGGGITNFGILSVSSSTIYGNGAVDGGGIYNGSSLTVINSTLSQNNAKNDGGGIYNKGSAANVYNTSILFNSADTDVAGGSAGGVYNNDGAGGTFNLRNTLVAGNNVDNSPIYDDCTGTLNSFGRNLFWMVTGCTVNNGSGGSWTYLNSLNLLGPLQNNGGPTWTHALLRGSNAIDGADPVFGCVDNNGSTIATDQRGWARAVGPHCDVGAFEYDPPVFLPLIRR
jgi:hypothetical protein